MPAASLLPAASPWSRRWLATFAAYAGAVALCLGILVWVLRLDQANLRVPFPYKGDALSMQMSIKGLVENGWYLHNDRLGAPMGADLHGYPRADCLHYLLIKLLSLRTSNFAILYNLYFLLTFPLTTLTSIYDRLRPDRPTHATGVGGGFVDPTVRLDVHFLPRGSSSPSSV